MPGRWAWLWRIKDALRSGDLYLPQSKQHVSFWDLTLSDTPVAGGANLRLVPRSSNPHNSEAKAVLTQQFHEAQ